MFALNILCFWTEISSFFIIHIIVRCGSVICSSFSASYNNFGLSDFQRMMLVTVGDLFVEYVRLGDSIPLSFSEWGFWGVLPPEG